MNNNYSIGVPTPTANITISKSRIKLYNKNTDSPTYYLQKGQEFEIELFNPTQETILAKIHLNNKPLSQGGLVLRPGERVFVERYLDVAKKFLFDTYEVSSSAEVQKAIEKNGDFKVEFFREKNVYTNTYIPVNSNGTTITRYPSNTTFTTTGNNSVNIGYNALCNGVATTLGNCSVSIGTSSLTNGTNAFYTNTSSVGGSIVFDTTAGHINMSSATGKLEIKANNNQLEINPVHPDDAVTMDWMIQEMDRTVDEPKTVETGRVEKGSKSDQKIQQVQMDFQHFPFHTIEAKLLPMSQKINTSKDLNVRHYCTNCGHKTSKGDHFCSSCGKKL